MLRSFIILGQSKPNCQFTQKGYIGAIPFNIFDIAIMCHHNAKFKKNPYIGFQEQSKQVFRAQIRVKMTQF